MWTNENRGRYDRSQLRYPSDLTAEEWRLIEPLIPPAKPGGNKRTVVMREVVNGLMYILGTGCQWRTIPKDLAPRSTICSATGLMAGRIASSKNVTEDCAVVAGDRSGPIYFVSISGSSPSASSADDLPKTIRCAISRRHSFRRRCSVRS